MSTADVLNYNEQGGARTVIGGEIDIVAGGALKVAGSTEQRHSPAPRPPSHRAT